MSFCPLTTLSQLKLLSIQLKTLLSAQLDKSVGVDFNNASNIGLEFCAWIRQFCNTLYTPEKNPIHWNCFFFCRFCYYYYLNITGWTDINIRNLIHSKMFLRVTSNRDFPYNISSLDDHSFRTSWYIISSMHKGTSSDCTR